MASSSSTPSSTITSSYELSYHDVFLSFNPQDTRRFVNRLSKALDHREIRYYNHNEVFTRSGPFKAIESSQASIIIFSENYAESSSLLEELACIMKCKDSIGQIVLPIFYDMNPSDVRNEKRSYGEAFAKYEAENNKNVKSWRKALQDVCDIAGWIRKHIANGNDSKLIEEIVMSVSHRLSLKLPNANEVLIGMEARLQDLKSQLNMGSGSVRVVGIQGVGGGGKTTLASCVYNEISSKFDSCCFLNNIKETTNRYGLKTLQERLLMDVLKKELRVESVGEGQRLIRLSCHHRNVLIVLDDVYHDDQLKAIAGSHDWFGEGSRIIITTRNEYLLKVNRVDVIYNIRLLNDVDAIKLFQKHAPHVIMPIEDYETLSKSVVSHAGGLPLALKVMGCFLHGKDINVWHDAIRRWDIDDGDIMEILKISYDGLLDVEKELFLDIACFFRGKEIDRAMVILESCGFRPFTGVNVLIRKSLLTISEGKFDMQNLIQEMGHYIVQREHPYNPEKQSRVWHEMDIQSICAMDARKENYTIEALTCDSFVSNLPRVLANMKKLRWISLGGFPSMLTKFRPYSLCCLILERSSVKQLWEDYKFLPSLKLLDLRHSEKLISTPDLKGLPYLERLILKGCKSLTEIHPSIGDHSRLVSLDMEGCSKLKMFPPITRMTKLETLNLAWCSQLQKFSEIQYNKDNVSLPSLELHDLGHSEKPINATYFDGLPSLERLILTGCKSLKHIHPSIGYLERLVSLDMEGCSELKAFPPIMRMTNLETLNFSGCDQLQKFSEIQLIKDNLHVLGLKLLDLRNLEKLTNTPDIGRLPGLRRMILKGCKSLKEIHPSIGNHERLVYLDMKGCSELKSFPPITRMTRLETLKLSLCSQLLKFPVIQTNMDGLVKLRLNGTGIEIVPSSIGIYCTNLESLDLSECDDLKSIEGDFSLLKHLKELRLEGCRQLENFADDFFDVEYRLDLLSLCTKSQYLASMKFPHFSCSIRRLNLYCCNLVDGDIPDEICELSNLEALDLSANKFSRLDSCLSKLPRLKFLNLTDCYRLVELPILPSSIAILKACLCHSLKIVGDLSDYKSLWKVSLWRMNNVIRSEKAILSMLQGNAIEDHFMSLTLASGPQKAVKRTNINTMQLPQNWYDDFIGFLICVDELECRKYTISIRQEKMHMDSDSELHHMEKLDETTNFDAYRMVGYVSFGSLRDNLLWDSMFNKISFQITGPSSLPSFEVKLVPRERKVFSLETAEFWDEEVEGKKTFEIHHDSMPSIEITWSHGYY